jgi:uncharacterized protein (DUF1800 family)
MDYGGFRGTVNGDGLQPLQAHNDLGMPGDYSGHAKGEGSMDRMTRAAAIAAIGCWGASAGAMEPTAVAVEYFHAALGHYFVTANATEMREAEAAGWSRTGGELGVFARAGDAAGAVPVCRFYSGPGYSRRNHLYTADPVECETLKARPGLVYEGSPFYAIAASGNQCAAGTTPVYRNSATAVFRNDYNQRLTSDATVYAKSAAAGRAQEGVAFCATVSAADAAADAVRLLRQASFGPTESEIARVVSMGAAAWVDSQLALPAAQYPAYAWMPANRPDSCVDDRTQPVRPDSFCARDNYTLFPLQLQFFRNALTGPDQLRQRVAFALSQVMVTSGVDNSRNYAMRAYQQVFLDRAFGNFLDLLSAVTLSPVMGDYLDMVNNNKTNAAAGTDPNENYAREILQLFSVGTDLLNPDGTKQLDQSGKTRPTYQLAEIKGFSRVFTGWTYPTVAGAAARNNNPRNYAGDMLAVDANHEFGAKLLLAGVSAPANLTMAQDLDFAHRNIFGHANVGPFIGKQLIQKLVTSEPSPAYVARITAAFNDNGAGQRGDLRAVVRAILLDPEARGARKIDPDYGKLVEPVLYMTGMARALNGQTDGVFFRASSNTLGQFVFYAPSVFNYYPFDYPVPGTTLLGPEFGIQTSTTAIGRANVANTLVMGNGIAPDATVFGATGTQVNLASYQAVAMDAAALADRLDRNLLAGRMSAGMRSAIIAAVNAASPTDALARARAGAWLVMTSPQYQVQR